MPHFLAGDELGHIKSIHCSNNTESSTGWKLEERVLYRPPAHAQINSGQLEPKKAKESSVQRLSMLNESDKTVLAAAKSDGKLSLYALNPDDGKLEILKEWKESRYKSNHRFIGLDASPRGLFWCTSNGALGLSTLTSESESSSSFQKSSLPIRLCAWRLSSDTSSFTYGGDEVDLSVWDTERAFQNPSATEDSPSEKSTSTKKRKRGGELFPAEIWRAKNLPNDSLNLRQPIYITSLSYLPVDTMASNSVHLVTGTEFGDVRRYDTRAARRPVASWTGVAKTGGVSMVEAGLSEHELFASDNGTNFSVLDLRNGRVIYSYKKLQGAVTSLAPSSNGFLGSTSRDRYFRLHSTFPPPKVAGAQQEQRGEVLGALYMKSVPTALVCFATDDRFERAGVLSGNKDTKDGSDEGDNEDEIWAGMRDVDESDGEDEGRGKVKRQS